MYFQIKTCLVFKSLASALASLITLSWEINPLNLHDSLRSLWATFKKDIIFCTLLLLASLNVSKTFYYNNFQPLFFCPIVFFKRELKYTEKDIQEKKSQVILLLRLYPHKTLYDYLSLDILRIMGNSEIMLCL